MQENNNTGNMSAGITAKSVPVHKEHVHGENCDHNHDSKKEVVDIAAQFADNNELASMVMQHMQKDSESKRIKRNMRKAARRKAVNKADSKRARRSAKLV